ncbi:MAG: undecaprenyl-diphosphate phosphatase [Firmicutes bacterium]|nr:undecaprenyl-diphosphate phosphatase [Candidatus Caballimonas caccae]
MEIWQAIVLGAVQGFAEFLPISSSGHLLLMQKWFGLTEGVWFFNIMLHIGTLIPVLIVLWKDVLDMFKKPFSRFGFWVLASIPAGIVGLIIALVCDLDEIFLNNIWLLGITFLLTAGELVFSERFAKKNQMLNPINVKTALIMGCGQACGVLPGLSRSGTTITAGTIAKVDRNENAVFTFIMSIPVILAAAVLEGYTGIKDGTLEIEALPLIFGMVTAMVTGYIAVKFMLKIIRKADYKWFSLYLVLISIATFVTAFI